MNPALKLKVKYGLYDEPSEAEVEAWVRITKVAIDAGIDAEEAGRNAAFDCFTDVDSCVYGSEADNIEALLKALSEKG